MTNNGEATHPEVTVLSGDAFDLIDQIDDEIDLVLTSPPFWGLRSYGLDHREDVLAQWKEAGNDPECPPPYCWYRKAGGILGLEPYPHWYIAHLVEFFEKARGKLRQSGSMWVNLGDTYFARWSSIRDEGRQGLSERRSRRRTPSGGYLRDKQLLLVPARFAIAMQESGWILRNDMIWSKPNVMPRPESDRLRLSHEHWFHFVLRNSRGRPKYHYDLAGCEEGARDVVTAHACSGEGNHSATFPSTVVRPRILSSCPPGGLVLDPFCGSGRALVEALDTERRAIGFELSESFAKLARANVADAISRNGDPASHDLKGLAAIR
ncbi:DNA-methyltransferase [Candidatus Poriferisodalis sp.]|uniref:DNA-methyltransferase n=1 Tax=Candidatus Poriferisodalis sp. TaxID=3101277 RepID=UPI003B01AAE1